MSQQINLYHPIFRKEKKTFSLQAMLNAAAVLIVGIALMFAYVTWNVHHLQNNINNADRHLVTATKRLQDIQKKFKQPVKNLALAREVRRHEQLIAARSKIQSILRQGIFTNTSGYSNYFLALARQHTPGVWLTEISITGAGEKMILKGRSTLANRVPRYLQKLSQEKTLSGIEFDVFQITRPEADKKQLPVRYVDFIAKTVIQKKRISNE